jgi:hypothetical protein
MGVSAVPAMAAQPEQGCRFVRLAGRGSRRKIGIVRFRNRFETRAERAFVQHAAAACETAPPVRTS